MTRYFMHGYSVYSHFGLHLPTEYPSATSSDPGAVLHVTRGEDHPVPREQPGGEPLAEVMDDDRRTYYQFARLDTGIVLRFHDLADFVGDESLTHVRVHLAPGADPALVPVLVNGSVIATRMILDGHLVLHASAIKVGAGTVAFVGMSGMGKSTMAALSLAAGYVALTDDVLRVDLEQGCPQVWPGSTELRLRETARAIAEQSGRRYRPTADGRTALSTGAVVSGTRPLSCCIVPRPDRAISAPSVRVLDPFTAVLRLVSFPRIVGWQDPATAARQFDLLVSLCERTPVLEAHLPWGPPFPAQLTDRLLDCIDSELGTALRDPAA